MSEKTDEFLEKLAPCIEKGDLEACLDEASKLAEDMGISGEELLDLSSKFRKEGELKIAYASALAASRHLIEDKQARAYNIAGIAARSLNHYDKSETCYKKAIESDQKYASAHYNYAILLKELDRMEEAEVQYKKAIESDPEYASAHNNFAIFLKDLDRMEEAEDQYKKAIESDPKYASAHYNYAILLKKFGRKEEAEDQYKKAVESDPKYAQAHYNYAILLKEFGRLEAAENQYKNAIESDPKYTSARNNYANLLREQERLSEAECEVRTALQNDRTNPYALSTLGDILADEAFFEEAEKQYKKALTNSSSMDKSALSEVHNNLGYVYFQLKKIKQAEKEIQKAKVLSGNIKAIRNLRAIKRASNGEANLKWGLPMIQKCFLVLVILILLGFCYYLFLFWEIEGETRLLSDSMFVAQSSILMSLLIFVLFANQLARMKVGTQGVELEMSTEHRSISAEAAPMLERS